MSKPNEPKNPETPRAGSWEEWDARARKLVSKEALAEAEEIVANMKNVPEPTEIIVKYTALDGTRKTGRYKTLKGAMNFAQKWVGKHPEISHNFGYAVSGDGVGKVAVSGCSITELFPPRS